jgi:hypothetical protein
MAKRLLICTDLNRTLLPNGPQPEAHQHFATLVGQRGATVADANFYRPFINDWQLQH